ncbi:MAG: HEAT repeat domain-containing protein [Planctomycetes bacterium]|nr:HEAT repeat domain-containing protein [Planctomycetota bacterium]
MIRRCPNCQSPIEAPEEEGVLVTCSYCDKISRTYSGELFALREWDATAEAVKKQQAASQPEAPPAEEAGPAPGKSPGMRLPKKAWKAPPPSVAAPLFPPEDPVAAARAMSPKEAEPEVPPVPLAVRVRPLLRFAGPAVAAVGLLAVGMFAWSKIAAVKGKGEARPAGGGAQGPPVDREAARRAALAEAAAAAARRLDKGGSFEAADVPALVELLAQPGLRAPASLALGNLGPAAEPAVPTLLALFDDPRAGPAAVDAASRIAPRSPEVRDALETLLGGELKGADPVPVRLAAVAACDRLGPEGATPLGGGLRSVSPEVREASVRALVKLGPPALHAALSALHVSSKPDTQAAGIAVLEGLRDIPLSDAWRPLSDIGIHPPADRALFRLLRGMGPEVIPRMLETLDAHVDRPGEDWWEAARECLESFGGSAVPIVRDWLEEHAIERPRLRAAVMRAAGTWGREALPFLVPALTDGDPGVRGAAVESLGQIGPRAGEAWEALESGATQGVLDDRVAAAAVRIRGAEAVPLLVQLLLATAEPTRLAAARELGALGAAAAPAVPDLVALLGDAALRPAACAALVQIGDPAVDALVTALQHDVPEVRTAAAATLGKLGARTPAVAPALAQGLADEVKEPRDAALRALMAMGSEGRTEFEKALRGRSRAARTLAVWALGQLGPAAAGSLPALRAALKDGDDAYRKSVVKAMARMGPPAVAELAALLKHEHAGVREWSAQALGELGADAASALPALKAAMEDREPAVQAAAEEAVRKLEGK